MNSTEILMMMSYENNKPHVCFELNKEMDHWTVAEFLTFDSDDPISNTILDIHPSLKNALNLNKTEKTSFYKSYVDGVYAEKEEELINTKKDLQKSWDLVEQRFLDETAKIFNNHPWPKGFYTGFLSIFNCNPRFLDEKNFQVYYKHPEGLTYACAHEMLHFMFYDYLEKNPDLVKNVDESFVWDLSEIFNVLVLEKPEFVRITGNSNPRPYTKHKKLLSDFRKAVGNFDDAYYLIEELISLLV